MTAEDYIKNSYENDPLERFEPQPIPRRRLIAQIILNVITICYIFVPIEGESSLASVLKDEIYPGIFKDTRATIDFFVLLLPSVSLTISSIINLPIIKSPNCGVSSKWASRLSVPFFPIPIIWLITSILIFCNGRFLSNTYRAVFVITIFFIFPTLAIISIFIAKSPPSRVAAANITALLLNISLISLLIAGIIGRKSNTDIRGKLALMTFFLTTAMVSIEFSVSCLLVYRRHRKIEREFHAMLAERDRQKRQ